ncbi:MAG: heme ABC exporter ATP-binding protein CcmA [SAR324 cluster bacterium]|nr:heme ABC exporter ATP-binding protein CcmA [SAR324 cluster bacterium]
MQLPPLFSVSNLEKRFGHHKILRGVSFDIFAGDFLLLLGSNGAGKSTLLRILSSLMRPSAGELLFDGQSYSAAGARLRGAIGMVAHESQFYGDLTARENLKVFGTMYGVRNLPDKITAALREMNLDSFPDVPVRAFSGGMTKRLALSRLALYRPRVLLMDEPYAGLDQESVLLLDSFLDDFKSSGGTTVMVTHQFTNGVAHCNRLLILHQGGLVYNQTVQDITADHCAKLLHRYSRTTPSSRTSQDENGSK